MTHTVSWVIGSTGSDTYGTTLSAEIAAYLEEKHFIKVFGGNPTFSTNHPYSDSEMKKIAQGLKKIRTSSGQKNVEVTYWKASSETSL